MKEKVKKKKQKKKKKNNMQLRKSPMTFEIESPTLT